MTWESTEGLFGSAPRTILIPWNLSCRIPDSLFPPHLHLTGTLSCFIITHHRHLPILASRIQKCRARITTHPLVFINNILQFPRPGAWINYSSASRLRWSKRWPGWPSSRVGIKGRLWLHRGARLRREPRVPGFCFVAARQSDIWKCMNSDFKVLLEKGLTWQADVTFTSFTGVDRRSLLTTVHLALFSCSLRWEAPRTQPRSYTYTWAHTHTHRHTLSPDSRFYRLNCVPRILTLES